MPQFVLIKWWQDVAPAEWYNRGQSVIDQTSKDKEAEFERLKREAGVI